MQYTMSLQKSRERRNTNRDEEKLDIELQKDLLWLCAFHSIESVRAGNLLKKLRGTDGSL